MQISFEAVDPLGDDAMKAEARTRYPEVLEAAPAPTNEPLALRSVFFHCALGGATGCLRSAEAS